LRRIDIDQAICNDTPIIRWGDSSADVHCVDYFTSNPEAGRMCPAHNRPQFKVEVGGDILGIKGRVLCRDCISQSISYRAQDDQEPGSTLFKYWVLSAIAVFVLYTVLVLSLHSMMQPVK
tara:strand:- start:1212 stop:1571 length:360 start_codon:yes stop_codon:yes gene_type:complete